MRIDTTTLPGVTMLVHKDQVSYFGKKHTMRSFEKVYRTIPRHTHASMHEIRGKYKKVYSIAEIESKMIIVHLLQRNRTVRVNS